MEAKEIVDRLLEFIKNNLISVLLGLFGFILISYGLISLSASQNSSENLDLETSNELDSKESTNSIKVDVEGAVLHPGVYSFSSDARYKDALVAAGGLSAKADRAYVSKAINLAQKLKDGEKVYVAFEGSAPAATVLNSGTININMATESELDSLPGIGKVTALKIIQGRPYSQIEDLTSKKIISQSVFEKIKDSISVY
ncbi:ComEA family DNA-binding protein [Patescibacteria group bacterium]|nr:ComEA family DNA-binding protein [Patescibacteria group bacterium]